MSRHHAIAIIPARFGSKRIPQKNIKEFLGKPIIAYSIETAKESNIFDRIIVSTDSEKIAEIALNYGAEVPFLRPAELSGDFATTDNVLVHALQWFAESGISFEYACCLYPSAPLINKTYLLKGYKLLISENATSAIPVCKYSYTIFRSLMIKDHKRLQMLWPEYLTARSQDLPETFHDIGQFYWVAVRKYLQVKRLLSDDTVPVILPNYMVQDIDTLDDWKKAEIIYKMLHYRNA